MTKKEVIGTLEVNIKLAEHLLRVNKDFPKNMAKEKLKSLIQEYEFAIKLLKNN